MHDNNLEILVVFVFQFQYHHLLNNQTLPNKVFATMNQPMFTLLVKFTTNS
jgi:hypothetical protein